MKRHLFQSFPISDERGCSIFLSRCRICRAIKITIKEYGKEGIIDDDLYLRGSQYCTF